MDKTQLHGLCSCSGCDRARRQAKEPQPRYFVPRLGFLTVRALRDLRFAQRLFRHRAVRSAPIVDSTIVRGVRAPNEH